MTHRLLLAGLAATALAGLGACAETAIEAPTAAAARSPAAPITTADYVTMAAQSDEFERQAGMLAQKSATNAQVRQFGQKMVTDHRASTQKILAAAQRSGLKPSTTPPALRPDQQQMLDELRRASGPAFDRLYVTQQIKAHQAALALHQAYAANGGDAALKRAAAEIVPVVQGHLMMVQAMQAKMR